MASGIFITGTGTGVGKTYVGTLIAKALRAAGKRVGVYKPVASGCERQADRLISPDAIALWEAAGRPGTLEHVCPQVFAAPLAPHLAARAEGRRVDSQLLRDGLKFWCETCDIVLVEGAGGLMSPISEDDYNADLAAEFGYPLLIVAENALGTINATLQTLITARQKGVRNRFFTASPNSSTAFDKTVPDTFLRATFLRAGLPVAGIVLNSPHMLNGDPSVDSNADELARRCTSPLLAIVDHGGGFSRNIDWNQIADSNDVRVQSTEY
jgi:dethiobiotin synthetase